MRRKHVEIFERTSLRHFLKTSSLSSLKYLQKNNRSCLHIFLWTCINVVYVVVVIILTSILFGKLTENPTVTSLESTSYPVENVPFPAIAICNLNKISKAKTEDAIHKLSKKDGVSPETIEDYLTALGNFYDLDTTSDHKMLEFQKIIENVTQIEEFELNKLMKWLAPPCEELLIKCKWKNKEYNCSDIFQMRLTFEGYCCIFNYVKNTSENIMESFRGREILTGSPGREFGLTVEINNTIEDYFYTKQASLGANVLIFNPTDYPDKNSGGLNEHLVGINTEFFMLIEVTKLYTVSEVIKYPIDKRECYFQNERRTSFGAYSESDCVVDCRIKSLVALCGCVPFVIPQNSNLICDLSDINCLSKFKNKWNSLMPPRSLRNKNLLGESHYSVECEERCYPDCNSDSYEVITNAVPIKNKLEGNKSILHIFFIDRFSTLYKQDLYYNWYDILSNIGNVSGFIFGISLISILEIIVFAIYKIHKYFEENLTFDEDFCALCLWSF